MDKEIFEHSKNIFLDSVDAKSYIQIESIANQYKSLLESIAKPLKMILIYGRPGTGKSMLLSKLYSDLFSKQDIFLYTTPIIDEDEFFSTLGSDILHLKTKNFTQFVAILKNADFKQPPLVLLDEAQLYSDTLMEKIRLLSDTRKLKFIITLHKTQEEDLIAKEHFQTRIWESIELVSATKEELKLYIVKKLIKENCYDNANMFDDKAIKKIHKITKGNYRDTNKLLYTIFELYLAYEELNMLHKVSLTKVSTKMIEMAGLQRGLLNG